MSKLEREALNQKELQKRIKDLECALKVIRTWASVSGALVPSEVVKLCDRNLK